MYIYIYIYIYIYSLFNGKRASTVTTQVNRKDTVNFERWMEHSKYYYFAYYITLRFLCCSLGAGEPFQYSRLFELTKTLSTDFSVPNCFCISKPEC